MKVLVDSSVWIEFFRLKTPIPMAPLEFLIQERRVATCLPIKAEVLSGKMASPLRDLVEKAFDAMDFIDLDWNSKDTWNGLVELALRAQKKRVALPGTIDRMILACCLKSKLALWTLDRKLRKLAKAFGQSLFQP